MQFLKLTMYEFYIIFVVIIFVALKDSLINLDKFKFILFIYIFKQHDIKFYIISSFLNNLLFKNYYSQNIN